MKRLVFNPKLLGIAFLVLLLAGVYATYAVFTKKFVDYEEVKLQTSTIGLQLPERADVKIRGVIVGEVIGFESTGDGAELTLGLFPEEIDTIPENVTGSIVPKTLFGEKYVSLIVPDAPSSEHITSATTITRTAVSTEVEKVLSDLFPLLRTVQPAEINMTLNALATALEGRGEQLGESLETIDAYLKKINPRIPELVEDLRLTADVSTIYADVLPEIGQILDDTVLTTNTLEGRETQLNNLLRDVGSFADTTRTFLDDNGDNIVRLGELNVPQLEVLAKYAPEFPCLTGGLVNGGARFAEAFRGFKLHIVLETLPRQPRQYDAGDVPSLGEDRGPACLNLPSPPWTQENPLKRIPDFNDGVTRPTGKGTQRVAPAFAFRDGSGYAGSPAENDLYRGLLAPSMGVSADEVGDLGPLLVAPMARGAEVSLR